MIALRSRTPPRGLHARRRAPVKQEKQQSSGAARPQSQRYGRKQEAEEAEEAEESEEAKKRQKNKQQQKK